MKYLDEYRDVELVRKIASQIHKITTRHHVLMEVCGGQTHSIVKFGIDQLLPKNVELVHGPGCPVCVTPLELIDKALEIASMENIIFCSFGDMLRVPGSKIDLFTVKSRGGDIRIVYSPLDALKIAEENPAKQIVFFAVGFETTAPANAMAVFRAKEKSVNNFSILVSQVLVPPAMEAILSSPKNRVKGFILAGHVCTIMGYDQYEPIADKYKTPMVVTGFEPVDILEGIYLCVKQLEEGSCIVENEYKRSVKKEGNVPAQKMLDLVFKIVDRKWRGIGEIPNSGYALRDEFKEYDAELRFNVENIKVDEPKECISGLILQGLKKPDECECFGARCDPEHPMGATMVSTEGACAAYFRYRKK